MYLPSGLQGNIQQITESYFHPGVYLMLQDQRGRKHLSAGANNKSFTVFDNSFITISHG